MNTDVDAVAYLQLATELCREVKPDCTLVAEDMSGMPGMCLPVSAGGVGFDYRLGMGLPDMWVRYLDKRRDEDWNVGELWHELAQRRPREKVVGYCESHDQALVGDKTIMFRLADADMYHFMDKDSRNLRIDRAMALHKMIRLITCTCAGEAYLNFMGNEFGHPEWIDFPRPGNGDSYHYARRRWDLPENESLRYHFLQDFDRAMIRLVKENGLFAFSSEQIFRHDENKLLAYRKGRFLFFFNFHPERDGVFSISLPASARLEPVLHTSWPEFGGYRPKDCVFLSRDGESLRVMADRRAALVFEERV
jgi:1,4-alpha-glucan branching enzyme